MLILTLITSNRKALSLVIAVLSQLYKLTGKEYVMDTLFSKQ